MMSNLNNSDEIFSDDIDAWAESAIHALDGLFDLVHVDDVVVVDDAVSDTVTAIADDKGRTQIFTEGFCGAQMTGFPDKPSSSESGGRIGLNWHTFYLFCNVLNAASG